MTVVIDGMALADRVYERLQTRSRPEGILVALLVGSDPASIAFLARKEEAARRLGIPFCLQRLPASASHDDVVREVKALSADDGVRAVLVQLPLPAQCRRDEIIAAIAPQKDVDALGEHALVPAPVVGVVEEIVSSVGWEWPGRKVALVGKGLLVGRPLHQWLTKTHYAQHPSDICVIDRRTSPEARGVCVGGADVVVSGVGSTGVVSPGELKSGAGYIDFGYPPDANQAELRAAHHLAFYTPTPRGTGPLLVAKVLENFFALPS